MLHAILTLIAQAPDSVAVIPGVTDQINILVAAGIGAVASAVLGVLKVLSAKIAGLPDIVKSILMGGISVVAVLVARFLHVDPTADLSVFVSSGLVALLGMGLRAIVHALGLDKVVPNAGA